MSDIAAAAGVSRQTLYKEFGNRNEFGLAFVIHEGERFLDDVDAAVLEHLDDPRAAIGAALELFLRTAGEDPLIRILLSDDGTGGMLPFVTTQGMPVVQWATARLAATIEAGLAAGPPGRRPAALRIPGPPRDQLHHRARASRPRRPLARSPTCSARSSTGRSAPPVRAHAPPPLAPEGGEFRARAPLGPAYAHARDSFHLSRYIRWHENHH